jgi:hypothetical protein
MKYLNCFENFKSYKKGLNVNYSAIILDKDSRNQLLSKFIYNNPDFSDWIKVCDHMTICMGELPEHMKRYWLDEEVELVVTEIGISEKAVAVRVENFSTIVKSNPKDEINRFSHITLAINPFDGKSLDSNFITDWKKITPITIKGVVKEVLN